jgi:hypothetical protein
MNSPLYIIVHTWKGTDMAIQHFFTPQKATKYLNEVLSWDKKFGPDDDPEDVCVEFLDWQREEERDDLYIGMEVIDLHPKSKTISLSFHL